MILVSGKKAKGRKQGTHAKGVRQKRYSHEFKLKAVKLFLEEGYPAPLIAQELSVGRSTIGWLPFS